MKNINWIELAVELFAFALSLSLSMILVSVAWRILPASVVACLYSADFRAIAIGIVTTLLLLSYFDTNKSK